MRGGAEAHAALLTMDAPDPSAILRRHVSLRTPSAPSAYGRHPGAQEKRLQALLLFTPSIHTFYILFTPSKRLQALLTREESARLKRLRAACPGYFAPPGDRRHHLATYHGRRLRSEARGKDGQEKGSVVAAPQDAMLALYLKTKVPDMESVGSKRVLTLSTPSQVPRVCRANDRGCRQAAKVDATET